MAYSCKILSTLAAEAIRKTWVSEQSGYVMVVWYYDDATLIAADKASLACVYDGAIWAMIGVRCEESTTHYIYRIGANYFITAIERSTGWHKIEFDFTDGLRCKGRIDDTEIFDVDDPDTFKLLELGNMWAGKDGINYFDDVDIGALFSDDFETCDLAGWTIQSGTPECSDEQNHTPAPPVVGGGHHQPYMVLTLP